MLAPTQTSTATNTAALPAVTATPSQGTALASDFETFLKMLTAQARYQDPLEPLDSSEYAAQLAQFSMVEQQVQSNELLTALASQMGAGNMAQLAGWIGMEARTTAPVAFDGTPVTFFPNPAAASDDVQLVVYDANDVEVQRNTLPVAAQPVVWAGVADDGTPFANGTYRFEVESRAQGEVLVADPAESYARVTETRLQNGETMLILKGGIPALSTEVVALREPR